MATIIIVHGCLSKKGDNKNVHSKGRRKKNGLVRKREGVGGTPSPKQNSFFFRKEKKTQNILKRKNAQTYFVTFLQGYPLKTILPIFS